MGNHRGQTLVELALVLPCFCLGIFMAVQLIWYCHNLVELQRMSMVALGHVSNENYRDGYKYYWFHSLYGKVTVPKAQFQSHYLSPWRPFQGLSNIKKQGRIVHIMVDSDLLPGSGFTKVLSRVTHAAEAETILEPSVPEDK